MQKIELLMRELNLGDEQIFSTLVKIDYLCAKNGYTQEYRTRNVMNISGNGDGNGNN
jgi:hypothetical protein